VGEWAALGKLVEMGRRWRLEAEELAGDISGEQISKIV